VENLQRAEEHDEVIDVIEDLINYHDKLSTVCNQLLWLIQGKYQDTIDPLARIEPEGLYA
jgi:hypothetical protein